MTKEELKASIEAEQKKYRDVVKKENLELKALYEDVFSSLEDFPEYSNLAVEIGNTGESCQFLAKRENYDYKSEIFCVYFKTSSYKIEEADRIELNYYTTSDNSDDEINRLILLGEVARLVQRERQYEMGGLLQEYNTIKEKYSKQKSEIYKREYDFERQLRSVELKEKNDAQDKRFKKAFSKQGIKIEKNTDSYGGRKSYPNIQLRGDRVAYNVSNIRILNYVNPETKKTVNIEITETPKQYDYEKQKYFEGELSTYKVNKVRLDKIHYYITKLN